MIAHIEILEGDNVRPVFKELHQEVKVLRLIAVIAEVEL
jgi:hypothetical protein